MKQRPELIGTTGLWTGRIVLDPPLNAAKVQQAATDYVEESGITVVGYYMDNPSSLTLLRWPEIRPGFRSPTIAECNAALSTLAQRLHAKTVQKGVIPARKIHVMMGRKKKGYGSGEVVPIEALRRDDLSGYVLTEGYMISARTVKNAGVESYGEPIGIIIADPSDEAAIHELADKLEQHHYVLERGANNGKQGKADHYRTRWAPAIYNPFQNLPWGVGGFGMGSRNRNGRRGFS